MKRYSFIITLFVILLSIFMFSNCSDKSTSNENDNEFDVSAKFEEFLTWVHSEHSDLEITDDGNWDFEKNNFSDRTEWSFLNSADDAWEIVITKFESPDEPLLVTIFRREPFAVWLRVVQNANGEFLEIFGGIEETTGN
ncbi:hypothetical protein ACFL4T_08215 [candidate division KSB1 bacterium]